MTTLLKLKFVEINIYADVFMHGCETIEVYGDYLNGIKNDDGGFFVCL